MGITYWICDFCRNVLNLCYVCLTVTAREPHFFLNPAGTRRNNSVNTTSPTSWGRYLCVIIALCVRWESRQLFFDSIVQAKKKSTLPALCEGNPTLTHLPLDKLAAISQTIFLGAFSWMKSFVFRSEFLWSLSLRVQLTINQHWFGYCLGAEWATSYYLKVLLQWNSTSVFTSCTYSTYHLELALGTFICHFISACLVCHTSSEKISLDSYSKIHGSR